MNLSKRNDPARRWRSFKRHSWFILPPLAVACAAAGVWYLAQAAGLSFSKEDESILIGAVVTTLGVAYAITVTLILGTVWERYQKVVLCILKRDRETFLCYRDERIPVIMYLLIAALSLPLLVIVGGLQYSHVWAGFASVFSVTFVLVLYWHVIVNLQNPLKSVWLAERVPEAWVTADIDAELLAHDSSRNK
jgi:hypothetical protein